MERGIIRVHNNGISSKNAILVGNGPGDVYGLESNAHVSDKHGLPDSAACMWVYHFIWIVWRLAN